MARESNRKGPNLVGYKMSSLWADIRYFRKDILRVLDELTRHHLHLNEFRTQWSKNPPNTKERWLQFWLEHQQITDKVHSLEVELRKIGESLDDTSLIGMDVVRQNGIPDLPESDEEIKKWFENLAQGVSNGG